MTFLRLAKLLILLAYIPGGPALARGGAMSSGGGELITWDHNPWFIGNTSVRWCLETSNEFSLAQAKAVGDIASAFADWSATLGTMEPLGLPFATSELAVGTTLASTFQEVSCEADPDIIIKLGGYSPEIEAFLQGYAFTTLAFSRMTSFNPRTGRAKGLIWFAPDIGPRAYAPAGVRAGFWSSPHVFFNVALHEIGHTFGLRHEHGGIMDADWPATMPARASRDGVPPDSSRYLRGTNWWVLGGEACTTFGDDLALGELRAFGFTIPSNAALPLKLCFAGNRSWRDDGIRATTESIEIYRYQNYSRIPGWETEDAVSLRLLDRDGQIVSDQQLKMRMRQTPTFEPIYGLYDTTTGRPRTHWFVKIATHLQFSATTTFGAEVQPIFADITQGAVTLETFRDGGFKSLRIDSPSK